MPVILQFGKEGGCGETITNVVSPSKVQGPLGHGAGAYLAWPQGSEDTSQRKRPLHRNLQGRGARVGEGETEGREAGKYNWIGEEQDQ